MFLVLAEQVLEMVFTKHHKVIKDTRLIDWIQRSARPLKFGEYGVSLKTA